MIIKYDEGVNEIVLKKIILQTSQIDENVRERFSKGDKTAFGIIYHHYYKTVKTNISKIILQNDIAEDVLQDVFFKLWENRGIFEDTPSLSSWLFRVSYNTSITYIRGMLKDRKYVLPELPESIHDLSANEESVTIRHTEEGLLHEAIKLLPQRKKQVIDLCKFQGKSYMEAGSILGIEKDTVKEYLVASMKFIKCYILSNDAS